MADLNTADLNTALVPSYGTWLVRLDMWPTVPVRPQPTLRERQQKKPN
jgi:hypothetical protein